MPRLAFDPHAVFLKMLKGAKLPQPTPEFRFHDTRKWRFDYAFPDHRVALEVEGGIWTRGRHSRGAGMVADMSKYNTATSMGWRILRVTPDQLCTPDTLTLLRATLTPPPSPDV